MPDVKENRLPVFSWENLATTNIELAKKFYQGLFGWDVTDIPTGTYGTHSFFSLHGKEVCSVSEIKEKQRKSFASQWVPYISIENIEELIGRIQNAGGAVLDAISPIADAGQTTIIKDPPTQYLPFGILAKMLGFTGMRFQECHASMNL